MPGISCGARHRATLRLGIGFRERMSNSSTIHRCYLNPHANTPDARHAGGERADHVGHGDAHAANAGTSPALAGLNLEDVRLVASTTPGEVSPGRQFKAKDFTVVSLTQPLQALPGLFGPATAAHLATLRTIARSRGSDRVVCAERRGMPGKIYLIERASNILAFPA